MMTNYMTTIPGVLMLLGVIWDVYTTKHIDVDKIIAALGAVGLINAKDWNVTGGTRQ